MSICGVHYLKNGKIEINWKSVRRKYPDITTYRSVSARIRGMVKTRRDRSQVSSGSKKVFIYADESGNSGKALFGKSKYYYQGAIFSVGNIEGTLKPIVDRFCQSHRLGRIHANELDEQLIGQLCGDVLNILKKVDWVFHYTFIEKRFIAPTKFVDTVFDPHDNPAIPPMWYNTEMFRHMMVIAIDEMMDEALAPKFWQSFLDSDAEGLISVVESLKKSSMLINDKRVRDVIASGLDYAISHPSLLNLESRKGKSAYKWQTPNIIAFSSLFFAIHRFCKSRQLGVDSFIHDRSDEFKGTMREFHRSYFGFDIVDNKFGTIPEIHFPDYDLGSFNLVASNTSVGLQVCDLFLWVIQRDVKDKRLRTLKSEILARADNFFISRDNSLVVIDVWTKKIMEADISEENLSQANEILQGLEQKRQAAIKTKR